MESDQTDATSMQYINLSFCQPSSRVTALELQAAQELGFCTAEEDIIQSRKILKSAAARHAQKVQFHALLDDGMWSEEQESVRRFRALVLWFSYKDQISAKTSFNPQQRMEKLAERFFPERQLEDGSLTDDDDLYD